VLYYFAGWFGKGDGETIPVADNAFAYTLREPVGVVGRYAVELSSDAGGVEDRAGAGMRQYGRHQARPNTSLSLLKFAEYAKECGLPAGVLNVIPGRGLGSRNAMVDHRGIDRHRLHRSAEVGRELMARAARTLKKVSLELGGKSPNIVLPTPISMPPRGCV